MVQNTPATSLPSLTDVWGPHVRFSFNLTSTTLLHLARARCRRALTPSCPRASTPPPRPRAGSLPPRARLTLAQACRRRALTPARRRRALAQTRHRRCLAWPCAGTPPPPSLRPRRRGSLLLPHPARARSRATGLPPALASQLPSPRHPSSARALSPRSWPNRATLPPRARARLAAGVTSSRREGRARWQRARARARQGRRRRGKSSPGGGSGRRWRHGGRR
ncbi:hypothetical protein PVAP13_1KG242905 [Panicum virgatum]|uniref:Uncharacterized protein n=1 Tax=Panicum virgatum TaxID=38727 RepID=A0A8T0XH35_PANVG|nr:hypothetical protein PVAP13_1KG242905 [Panicum virgatum]